MIDFDTTFETFLGGCQSIYDKHELAFFPNAARLVDVTIRADGGQKFVRVIREEISKKDGTRVAASAHCFVAKTDGFNRKLGSWKAGDVFKADSWKTPARGARGNIFDVKNGLARMGEYGPAYNR